MANIEHKNIVDAERHEPKGASTAASNTVYSSDGAGSGTWQKVKNTNLNGVSATGTTGYFLLSDGADGFVFAPAAHGSIYFSNFGTPYTLAATTSYQKVAPTTTVGGGSIVITEGTNSRLTYTGAADIHLDLVFAATFDQSTGSNKDIYIALYKNGVVVPGSEAAVTTVSGEKMLSSLHRDVHTTNGDYFEVYCKVSAAATVNFYTVNLMASTAGAA